MEKSETGNTIDQSEVNLKTSENLDTLEAQMDWVEEVEPNVELYQPVEVGDLMLADLSNLDRKGEEFVTAILESLAVSSEGISEKELTKNFEQTVAYLNSQYLHAGIADLLKLDSVALREKIAAHIASMEKLTPELMEPSVAVKEDLNKATDKLIENIETYASKQGVNLGQPSTPEAIAIWVKNKLFNKGDQVSGSEAQKLRQDLEQQVEFLRNLNELGSIPRTVLDQEIFYIDDKNGNHDTAKLKTAIEYSARWVPSLTGYLERLSTDDNAKNFKMADKIIKAFELITAGYGEKPFTEEDSLHQFNDKTNAFRTEVASGNYLKQGYVQSVSVEKK